MRIHPIKIENLYLLFGIQDKLVKMPLPVDESVAVGYLLNI